MDEYSDVEKAILRTMFIYKIIGGKHTASENVVKMLPKDRRGEAAKALDRLVRKGFIVVKPTSYGRHISLNKHRVEEVKEIIG